LVGVGFADVDFDFIGAGFGAVFGAPTSGSIMADFPFQTL